LKTTADDPDAHGDQPEASPLAARLVGTWELVSREDRTRAGEPRIEPSLGSDPLALLFFDQAGNFAAQFMKRARSIQPEPALAGVLPNNSRACGGYDAYFGTYTVDEAEGKVATRLVGALSPENVGQGFTRAMSVAGDELMIRLETASPEGEPVFRTLRWKRIG
jgi:hypothetical protein